MKMDAIHATYFNIISDAINGSNKGFNLYDYTKPSMWSDMVKMVSEVDQTGDFNTIGLTQSIVKLYAIATTIINTPTEEKIILDVLRQRYLLTVESFQEDYADWVEYIENIED